MASFVPWEASKLLCQIRAKSDSVIQLQQSIGITLDDIPSELLFVILYRIEKAMLDQSIGVPGRATWYRIFSFASRLPKKQDGDFDSI